MFDVGLTQRGSHAERQIKARKLVFVGCKVADGSQVGRWVGRRWASRSAKAHSDVCVYARLARVWLGGLREARRNVCVCVLLLFAGLRAGRTEAEEEVEEEEE